jgi:hypothetical protein
MSTSISFARKRPGNSNKSGSPDSCEHAPPQTHAPKSRLARLGAATALSASNGAELRNVTRIPHDGRPAASPKPSPTRARSSAPAAGGGLAALLLRV